MGAAPSDLRPAPGAARPGRAGQLLRDADARDSAATSSTSSTATATTPSRSSSWSTAPPGVRDVRDTNICRIHVTARRGGPGAGLRGDRQPLEGRREPGGPEPQPDARPARGRGDLVSAPAGLLPLALGRSRPAGLDGARTRAACARLRGGRRCLRPQGRRADRCRDRAAATPDAVRSALLLTRNAAAAAPVQALPRSLRSRAASAPPSSTRATPTRRPASRAIATRRRCSGRRPARSASSPRQVAVAETGTIGVPLPVDDGAGRASPMPRGGSRAGRRRGASRRRS